MCLVPSQFPNELNFWHLMLERPIKLHLDNAAGVIRAISPGQYVAISRYVESIPNEDQTGTMEVRQAYVEEVNPLTRQTEKVIG